MHTPTRISPALDAGVDPTASVRAAGANMADLPLIETLVVGLVLAFAFGSIAQRIKVSPLVGYLMAGWLVGPYSPGFVADQAIATELAELGVILLMFGVGLHFSVRDLLAVRRIAVPGALLQIAAATAMGIGLSAWLGWELGTGLVFGLALSVASTVVLLRALQHVRLLDTDRGRIAVGWLIVEDLVMVLALVLIPALAPLVGGGAETQAQLDWALLGTVALTGAKVAAFVAVMFIGGRRLIPWTLRQAAASGSQELFRLSVLAVAMGVALGAAVLFGVSFALGAFFAGVILAESELSHEAAEEILPLRDAFAVLFFVSAGMLFNPAVLWEQPLAVLTTVLIVIVGKSIVAYALVRGFGRDHRTALTIAISLAQIGEFSFILVALGAELELLPATGRDLVVAAAIISICLNPLLFSWLAAAGPLEPDSAQPTPRARYQTATQSAEVTQSAEETPAGAAPAGGVRPDGSSGGVPELPVRAKATIPPPTAPEPDNYPVSTTAGAGGSLAEASVPQGLRDHTVLIGYGRVGSRVGATLQEAGEPVVVIEDRQTPARAARADGARLIYGSCTDIDVLRAANLPTARQLVIAVPEGLVSGEAIRLARRLGCTAPIVARADTAGEAEHLREAGADVTVLGESELARGLVAAAEAGSTR